MNTCNTILFLYSSTYNLYSSLLLPTTLQVLRRKLMPLNEMLGNQTETQLWALEMTPKGYWCDNKPIQARKTKTALNKTATKAQ